MMKQTMHAWLCVVVVTVAITARVYGSDGSQYGENQIEKILMRLEAAEERIQKLEAKLEQKCDCGDSEKPHTEKRQVSPNVLSGAIGTLLEHLKYKGADDESSDTPLKRFGVDRKSGDGNIGSVYTRWGRTTCGSDSALIYSGFAAGTLYTNSGGGSNIQCMPTDPEYNATGPGGTYTPLGGVEYQAQVDGIFPKGTHDQNVPCARCYTPNSAVMMIPGKQSCPESWMVEYKGYLMTEYKSHQRSTFECVDSMPEYVAGESADTNGALLYFTKAECSRLRHCPPYIADRPITCAVCSK